MRFQHHVHSHLTYSSVCSEFVFSRIFHPLAPTYFRRPAVWQKFAMSDVLCAFFAVKTVAILIGSYPKPWASLISLPFGSLFSTLARMMRMFSSMSSLPGAKYRHRASEYVQRGCQDDMMVIERRRRLNSALALHGGGRGATPLMQ